MGSFFLGLDNGGTTTKAAVFSADGKEIGVASVETAALTPKIGYVERDMEEMWDANCLVIRKVIEKTGIAPEDIAGVGICGHGKGLYLWGKDDRPAGNGIISTDNRAYRYPVQWKEDGTAEKVFERSCQSILACQPVSLLAWIRDNEEERYRNIRWVFSCKDYVRFRLTREAKAEYTDYSGDNLLNLHTRDYDEELLALFGIPEIMDALPPLCGAMEIAGYVTDEAAEKCGLVPGTLVIGGMFDIDACAIACGVSDESLLCMIAGTWSINEYVRKTPVLDGSVLMNSLFCLPEYCLIEESSPTSAGNQAWFKEELFPELADEAERNGHSLYEEMNAWVESVPVREFVPVFLPFLMASNVHPNAKGSLVGMSIGHTRRHIMRAVYEGIVFCHRYHFEKLKNSWEKAPETVRLAGGAARSAVFGQMFADILQMPVETVEANETGALGCAIGAAAATGVYGSLEDALKHMCRVSRRYLPDPDAGAVYEKKYRLYLRTIECLDGLWTGMQELIEES